MVLIVTRINSSDKLDDRVKEIGIGEICNIGSAAVDNLMVKQIEVSSESLDGNPGKWQLEKTENGHSELKTKWESVKDR